MDPEPRVVTLVLVTPDGEIVGQLPPVVVATPWWQEARPVVGRSAIVTASTSRSRPELAATLLAPVAAARQAVVYRGFLDAIESSEWPYHAGDPAIWLHRAAELARSTDTTSGTGLD